MELQVGVKVFLKNPEGKFLLLERNLEKYPDVKAGDKWDIVGGRITPGTSLMLNLNREVMEETKLTIHGEVTLIAAQDIMKQDKHVVRLTYTAPVTGEPNLDEEHKAFKWFTKDELLALPELDQYARAALEKLK